MSIRLIQDLHAGISRSNWSAVETAANRLRDDVEKTVSILAGAAIGSLPNDYPLSRLASDALEANQQVIETLRAALVQARANLIALGVYSKSFLIMDIDAALSDNPKGESNAQLQL